MRISDWSSDVCSSDLQIIARRPGAERHMLIIDPVPAVDIPALDLVDLAAKLVDAFFALLIQRQWFACRGFRRAGCQQRSEERRVGKEGVSPCRSRRCAFQ